MSLTKTNKDVADLKNNLINNIRECVDMFKNVFVFSFENMRTVAFKEVRAAWTDSRCVNTPRCCRCLQPPHPRCTPARGV